MAHRARLPHRCGGGGRADRAASGLAPSDGSRARGAAPGAAAIVGAAAHRAQHVWAVRRARRRARLLGAGARDGPRRRRLPAAPAARPRCDRLARRRGAARRPQRASPVPERTGGEEAGAFSAVTTPRPPRPRSTAADPRAVLALLLRVAVVAARASLSPLPRRRGWQALAAAVLEGVAALAFAAFDAAAAASLRAAVHLQREEWAAANEYVRLDDDGRRGRRRRAARRRRRTCARRCAAGLRRRRFPWRRRRGGGAYRVCGNARAETAAPAGGAGGGGAVELARYHVDLV